MRKWTRCAVAVVAVGAMLSFGCKKDDEEGYGDNAATTEYETPATTELPATTDTSTELSTDTSTDLTTETPPSQ